MIDLHSHILPGIDDGPGSEDESLAMAEAYVKAGFTNVAATPHAIPGTAWMSRPEVVYEKVDALNRRLENEGVGLKIYPGMEIALDADLCRLMDEKRIISIADGPFVLIELPFQRLPLGWEQVFFEVQSRGYQVLVAHPERCEQMMAHPGSMRSWQRPAPGFNVIMMRFWAPTGRGLKRRLPIWRRMAWFTAWPRTATMPRTGGRAVYLRQ